MNSSHLSYYISQAQQAQHTSLVDRGANGRLAGSNVRVLSKSNKRCTGTGIDQHGLVNLIMIEYTYYRKKYTIHSSGQVESHKNHVDYKSVKWVADKGLPLWMATLSHSYVWVDLCI